MTAVFVDLVGSTARAEQLDPEDVRALLRRYHETLRRELERYGGTVEKFIGDAVVAVFGAPIAHEDDPERAVRAALAVRDSIAELNERDETLDLHVRIGVATGEALVALGARPGAGRVDGRRGRDEHRGADPVGRPDRRDPRRGCDVTARPSGRSSSARTLLSRRRARPSPSRSGRPSRRWGASAASEASRRRHSSAATTSVRCSSERSRGSASTARRSS